MQTWRDYRNCRASAYRLKIVVVIPAPVLAAVKLAGSGIETADALIVAVARANGLVVATRGTNPFQSAGLAVINPWET